MALPDFKEAYDLIFCFVVFLALFILSATIAPTAKMAITTTISTIGSGFKELASVFPVDFVDVGELLVGELPPVGVIVGELV